MRRRALALGLVALAASVGAAEDLKSVTPYYSEGQLLILIPPDYPADALARNETAAVEVSGRVLIDGSLQNMKLASSPPSPALEKAVRDVADNWRLHPRVGSDCRMQEIETKVTIWFEIAGGKPKISYSLLKPEPLDPALKKEINESALRSIRRKVRPRYPSRVAINRNAPDESLQVAYARVESDGRVSSVSVVPRLYYKSYEDEIVHALSRWEFEPSPKGFCAEIPVHFKLT